MMTIRMLGTHGGTRPTRDDERPAPFLLTLPSKVGPSHAIALYRAVDMETLWAAMGEPDPPHEGGQQPSHSQAQAAFLADERLPYWAELWPAARALCTYICEQPQLLADHSVLDVGCGLGATTLAALCCTQARVTAMDYELQALRHVRENAVANQLRQPALLCMDWRAPAVAPGSYERILAADVLYEARFSEPLAAFLCHALAPGGSILLADPDRPFFPAFLTRAEELGLVFSHVSTARVPLAGQVERTATVHIHVGMAA